uniref:Uncharacterized protein n=1 Tax=Oryza nivara TaxID=4536 RepID=A0A0E0JBG6_ORYNI
MRPSRETTLGWRWRRRRMRISRAMNRTLSGSPLSNRTFFSATILPVSTFRALNTLLYVPCPIWIMDAPPLPPPLIVSLIEKERCSTLAALRGTQPWTASAAAALSHDGHPAATCSASTYLWMFPSRTPPPTTTTDEHSPPPRAAAFFFPSPSSSYASSRTGRLQIDATSAAAAPVDALLDTLYAADADDDDVVVASYAGDATAAPLDAAHPIAAAGNTGEEQETGDCLLCFLLLHHHHHLLLFFFQSNGNVKLELLLKIAKLSCFCFL